MTIYVYWSLFQIDLSIVSHSLWEIPAARLSFSDQNFLLRTEASGWHLGKSTRLIEPFQISTQCSSTYTMRSRINELMWMEKQSSSFSRKYILFLTSRVGFHMWHNLVRRITWKMKLSKHWSSAYIFQAVVSLLIFSCLYTWRCSISNINVLKHIVKTFMQSNLY